MSEADAAKLEGTVASYAEGDFHHMNADYGALVLRAVFDSLTASEPQA